MPLFSQPICLPDLPQVLFGKVKWKTGLKHRAGFLTYSTNHIFFGRTKASYENQRKFGTNLELSAFTGKQEIDENPMQTALRELREELGQKLFDFLVQNASVFGYERVIDEDNEYIIFILFVDSTLEKLQELFTETEEFDAIVSISLDGFGKAGMNPQGRLMLTKEYNLVNFYDKIVLSAYQLALETMVPPLESIIAPSPINSPLERVFSYLERVWQRIVS